MGRNTMKRALIAAVLSVGLIVGLASAASADDKDKDKDKPKTIKVQPLKLDLFQIGLGSLAGWIRGAGEPNQPRDEGQYRIYLQKNTKTANFSSAGGDFSGNVPKLATDLHTLAFDIPGVVGVPFENFDPNKIGTGANGYCNNGSPRFNVFSFSNPDFTGFVGTTFLGCAFGTKTQNSTTGWWTIRFDAPFTEDRFPGAGAGPTGNIIIEVILDEGIDVGGTVGNSPGNVVLDNLTVNNVVIGKPNNDD